MKNLEYLRGLMGCSLETFANLANVSSADVEAWEAGKAEPDLATKRDIAMFCGIDIDYLDGRMGASTDCILPFLHLQGKDEDEDEEDEDQLFGYWGQVGIKLWGEEFTKWYPISTRKVDLIKSGLVSPRGELGLVAFGSLNNRLVIFRKSAVERVILLDEACDHIPGDWNVSADEVTGMAFEVYRALDRRILEEKPEEESETYKEIIDESIENLGLKTEEDFHEFLTTTFIHLTKDQTKGVRHSYNLDARDIFDICEDIDDGHSADRMLEIRDEASGLKAYHNWLDITLIDAPLLPCLEIRKEQEEHFQEHYHDEEIDGDF